MIMEGILKNWKDFVNEGVTPEGKIELNYYAFDWDDNLLEMPTKIILQNDKGERVEMSTQDFAKKRGQFKELGLSLLPNPDESFINFRDNPEANSAFIEQAKTAPLPKEDTSAWQAFVKAINSGALFAIITARGHSPDTLEQAVKAIINENRDGINKNELVNNLRNYYKLAKFRLPSDNEDVLIDKYLNKCQFSPVSHSSISGASGAANPEKLKEEQFKKFKTKMQKYASKLRSINKKVEEHDGGFLKSKLFKIGFSDDDVKNVEHMKKVTANSPSVTVFQTGATPTEETKGGQR